MFGIFVHPGAALKGSHVRAVLCCRCIKICLILKCQWKTFYTNQHYSSVQTRWYSSKCSKGTQGWNH